MKPEELEGLRAREREAWDLLVEAMDAFRFAVEQGRGVDRLMGAVARARQQWTVAMEAVARATAG